MLSFIFALLIQPSPAALGDLESALPRERASMGLSKFAAQDLPQKKMKVQTAEKSTAKIHQYIFNGKVIAVSWSGHKTPDLSVLLGSHFQLYSHGKKLQPAPRGQRFQRIEHEGLVYQSAGHMRGIRGYAFLAPLPAGIHEEDFAASP